jgi:hypothetical protein
MCFVIIPDWNSLDAVRRAHSGLEGAALVFFALVVLFDVLCHFSKEQQRKTVEKCALVFFGVARLAEIVAYPYGQRNDQLSEQVISSLDAKAKDAFTSASGASKIASASDLKSKDAVDKAHEALETVGAAKEAAGRAKAEADVVTQQAQALTQYMGVVANSVNPRFMDRAKFLQLMKWQPKATVEIWYDPSDGESEMFANELSLALGKSDGGLGWDAGTKPFPEVTDQFVRFIRQDSGANGLVYAGKALSGDFRRSPLEALANAVNLSLGGWGKGVAMFANDPLLSDNNFVIGVGHHVINLPLWISPKPKKQSHSNNLNN